VIRQLYYTSLLEGPSGTSGFQFCARSDGIDDSILALIERLTTYEKPREISADADLSEFPIKFIYTKLGSSNLTLLAQVKFIGEDFSRRSGNYFAHSLVMDDIATDLDGSLPAELWGDPLWQSQPGSSESLPILRFPFTTSTRTRRQMDEDFLRDIGSVRRLAWLSAATDAAISGGRQVLIVGRTSSTTWQWIMAVSYLLGPRIAPRMSFCTYSHDPPRTGTHVVGLISSRTVDARHEAGFAVFDPRDGAIKEGSYDLGSDAGAVCATMLASAGLALAEKAWRVAPTIARPTSDELGAWYPILACALMSLGWMLAGSDLAAAVNWLTAHEVDGLRRKDIITGSLHQRLHSLSAECQSELVTSALLLEGEADEAGLDIAAEVEKLIVSQSLEELLGGADGPQIARLRTREGIAKATHECNRLADKANVRQSLRLLPWASRAGVPVDDRLIRGIGREAVALLALESAYADSVRCAAESMPAFRYGMVEQLARSPQVLLERVSTLFDPDLFEPNDFVEAIRLGESWVSLRAKARGVSAVEEFIAICEMRRAASQAGLGDAALVKRFWPSGVWSASEALAVADAFSADEILHSRGAEMLVKRFLSDPGNDRSQSLCWACLADHIADWPPEAQQAFHVEFARKVKECRSSIAQVTNGEANAHITITNIVAQYNKAPPNLKQYLAGEVPVLILRHHPKPDLILASCPQEIMSRFCSIASRSLRDNPHDIATAAHLFMCMESLRIRNARKAATQLETIALAPMANVWNRQDITAIARRAGRDFTKWVKRYRRNDKNKRRFW
jgi:hypothetical protein